jgi:aminopeptidase N
VSGDTSDQQPRLAPGTVVNAGQTGYFRTAYDAALWRPLMQRFAALSPVDQLGLIYDSRSLGEAGVAPMGNFLDLAARIDPAADPLVLGALVSQLTAFDDHYEGLPGQGPYRTFALSRLRPVLARLTWDARPGEPDNAAVARAAVLKAMGRFGDEAVIAEARRRFAAWRARPDILSGSGRETVLTIVARQADAEAWDQLHAAARAAAEPVEKSRLYRLLGAARDPALAERALNLALSGEPPATVVPVLIRAVAQAHPDRAFEFALANRAAVEAALEPASRPSFITGLATGSRSLQTAERVEAFAAVALPASAQPEAAKSVSAIRFRAEVIDKRLPDIDRWLAARPAG